MIESLVFLVGFHFCSYIVLRSGSIVQSIARAYHMNVPTFFGSFAFVPFELAVKYPGEFLVALLHHNFCASIDGLNIGHALGWDIGIIGVLW